MVCFSSSISVCSPVDQSTLMASSLNSELYSTKSRQIKNKSSSSSNSNSNSNHHLHKNNKKVCSGCPNFIVCDGSKTAAIDLVISIAVIGASGFLLFPHIKTICIWLIKITSAIVYLMKEEFYEEPLIYGSFIFGLFCAAFATWWLVICMSRKCGNPKCKGLRKAAEFDIQLETEECVKNSSASSVKEGVKTGLFELPRDHHRELEAELRKMAPPNGRAVLVFRARCGCSVGSLEVPGPKKLRKIKK